MLTSHYDLYIGIGIGAVTVIIIILIATIIFCQCCVPSSSHQYFGRSVSHYAAINNIDAKNYFKPPQHLSYAPIVHRFPQPPVITQETSSQSARTSLASGGRLSILSEKLSRLSISSNQSGRPSVASDSVLLHKKGETGRLSHSYDDTDAQGITAHYASRSCSKTARLSAADAEYQMQLSPSPINSKNTRFQLFPRSSDAVEQSISSVDQSPGILEEQSSGSSKRLATKIDSNQNLNSGRRQSLLRSPSSRYAIPKFPVVGKQSGNILRASMQPLEQGFLSPPISPQFSSHLSKKKTLRGALGAIMPDLYFTGTACAANSDINGNSGTIADSSGGVNERINDELSIEEEKSCKLHVRTLYDEHRNDLVVNVIEAQCLPMERDDSPNPYVKLYLRPPIDQKLRQTSVQPQTINPIWNECFKFGFTNETILKTTKTLYLYIYNYAHSSRPECIGEGQLRLTSQILHTGGDLWCTINKQRAEDEYLGELLVSLTYLPQAERLNVGIIEARNLKALSMHIEADPIVRLTLQFGQTDKIKRKKTCVKRNTLNPKWNEEISFNISGVSLAESSLEIGLYHHDLIAPDEPLGFLRFENVTPISSANIAQHSEIIHWCEVINGEQRAACWHLLRKAAKIIPPPSSNNKTLPPQQALRNSTNMPK
ncbi:unnamed protein product [Rotaria socialis]|uniref:C2 domain-containing protein n=3 Tax=Rotaria socialis TaxID=392032 RepID=A0A817UHY9_9BILA|nr:unnamed protein product [Rotaria socialis]CAF3342362.1 unnamed protein product [Rotaria socialis]CAF3361851.1 unnamed protein product [Rotaria socialis]CAF4205436.1 unnamed protein product [Rotaria socialis]CAF4469443.1 unnamed protein product [Rotaria socialis]